MRRTALICVALILVTIAAYEPVRSCGFLNFDDPLYVTNNPRVFRGLTADGFFWAWTTFHAANWHPLTWLSHMLDCECFGDNPAAHHLVNLGIHTANVLLLFLGLKAMTGSMARSGWVAAFFALHPLHVESVAWISERKDVLSTLFWMLALLAYTRYAHARKPPRPAKPALKSAVGWYLLAYLAFASGLLCKPMLVTLPFLLLLLDYWPLQRVPPGVFASGKWSALLGEKIPFFALSIASSVVTYIAQSKGGAMATEETIPFLARLPNALVAYASYLLKMIWPGQLSVFYPHPIVWPVWTVIGAALLLVVVSILVGVHLRRRPYLLVGWLWYLGTLIPVIGLVQVGSQAMADRYTYVPLIGIFIMVVWTLAELVAQRSTALLALNCAAIVALAGCLIGTHRQVRHWVNSVSLFQHALHLDPESALAHHSLGQALSATGDQPAAILHFEEALRLRPDYYQAHGDWGNSLNLLGKQDQAIVHYYEAIRLKPDFELAYYHLANVLVLQGNPILAETNFHAALRINPRFTEAHTRLANLLVLQNRLPQAMPHYARAIELRPDDAEVRYFYGAALARQSRWAEAAVQFRAALRLQADHQPALNDLAWILATSDPPARDVSEAIRLAERACVLAGHQNSKYLDTLAVAYAEAGRFENAIATTKEAVTMAEANGQTNLASRIAGRLPFYEQGRSYRQMPP